MNEREIKQKFRAAFALQPDSLLIEELPLCRHSARADLAVVGRTISGYEIKSDRDNLSRLENQIQFYAQVFEFSTLLVAERHFETATKLLPAHWGIILVMGAGAQTFAKKRKATKSPDLCSESILELLWTDELLNIIADCGWTGVRKSWSRGKLRSFIASRIAPADAIASACVHMKLRRNWRAA